MQAAFWVFRWQKSSLHTVYPCIAGCFAGLRAFFFTQRQPREAEQQREQQAQIAEEGIRQVLPNGHAERMADEHATDAPRHKRVDDRARVFQRARKVARMQAELVVHGFEGLAGKQNTQILLADEEIDADRRGGNAECSASGSGQERADGVQQRRNHAERKQ